jgi:hypothetical protein
MKRILSITILAMFGLVGAFKANAQLHNMGLQMDMVWPKGGGNTKDFNSLYGGFFYEYRFTGKDIDVKELRDHFGLEFGLNYTEFIYKSNLNLANTAESNFPNLNYSAIFGNSNPYTKANNKGLNFYLSPKYYMEVYPDLVEFYIAGKVGLQYLNTGGSINGSNNIEYSAKSGSKFTPFLGASMGFEVKLGTVFVGTNFGFDTNSPSRAMKNMTYNQPNVSQPISISPFKKMDQSWGNLVLEFKVKALLNSRE